MDTNHATQNIDLPQKQLDVPHHYSVIFIFAIAIASQSFTLLKELYLLNKDNSNPDRFDEVHLIRQLEEQCLINVTSNGQPIDASPESTWGAIATTTFIALSVGGLALLLYEAFRCDPIVGKYVYDRKRLTQPNRAPPPLMLSRSLWHGYEHDSDTQRSSCTIKIFWKTPPALFELFFMTLDENYIQYTQAANEAMEEREKKGHHKCCRMGCYHNNCCNTVRPRHSSTVNPQSGCIDEDGYLFYPEFNHNYIFVHKGKNYCESMRVGSKIESLTQSEFIRSGKSNVLTCEKKWRKSIEDLYPEDFSAIFQDLELCVSQSLVTDSNSIRCDDEVGLKSGEESCSLLSDIVHNQSLTLPSNFVCKDIYIPEGNVQQYLSNSASPQAYTDSNERIHDFPTKLENVVTSHSVKPVEAIVEDSSTIKQIKYPYRISSFLLPPGFHNWSSAFGFYGEFFFIPLCSTYLAKTMRFFDETATASSPETDRGKIRKKFMALNPSEEELLRCAGLDTYLLIRFARFGFDVCFYPWCFACATVLPVYLSCDTENIFQNGSSGNDEMVSTATVLIDGFFSLTINRIEPGSNKMLWIFFFSFLLYFFILRRIWLEWEVVIELRHRFLANGDENFHSNPSYLQKFRNTCMVECIPRAQRSDKNVRETFEELFPGQIESAEMLIDTLNLENILNHRRDFIEKYESILAKHQYDSWKYRQQRRHKLCSSCLKESEPVEPKVRTGRKCCSSEQENALSFYKNSIDEYNNLADKEYDRIVELRLKWRDKSVVRALSSEIKDTDSSKNLYSHFLPKVIREALGLDIHDFFCGTAMVQFKSIAAKQGAVQCNLSGEPYWMITRDAPDPRDILWSNITVEHRTLERRKIIVEFLLGIAILTWGAFVTLVTNVATTSLDKIEFADPLDTGYEKPAIVGILRGYIPALIISLILLWMPSFLFYFAIHIIKFKSLSQCDEFVIKWSTAFRLANIFFIFFSLSLIQAIKCFKDDPENFIKRISGGVLRQSSFLLKLIIIATGQETMLQLLQWRSLIKHAVCRPLINLNAKSKRFLDWLNEAPPFEKSFIFGFFAPTLSYGLIIGLMYSYMAPLMLGACSFFFWVATKVHTHNALFIYCQPFEGGGKIFYYWNRIVFITLYSSISVFTGILALKQYTKMAVSFFIIMLLITYMVDKSITSTFVVHSLHLPMRIARIHDEEEVSLIESSKLKRDGGVNFMYRHPILNQSNWDSRPFQWM